MQIRIANHDDYKNVRDFYYLLIDGMDDVEYKPGWERDVYPTQEFITKSIENKELYIGEIGEQIASCMVVNHKYNDGYKDIQWLVEAEDSELLIIHALGVRPIFTGKGMAKEMVQKVIETARLMNIKTVRLDVLDGNIPAEKAYLKMGFKYLDTMKMFYEDTGWTDYKLFEYVV